MARPVRFPRWILTFADLMSLLLVMFVLLFALSGQGEETYVETLEAMNRALSGKADLSNNQKSYIKEVKESDASEEPPVIPEVSPDQSEALIPPLDPLYKNLVQAFPKIKGGKDVNVEYDVALQQIKITFPEQISFDPGKAELKPQFSDMLAQAFNLRDEPVTVQVIGHTDRRPVVGGRFKSNWELSSARAASVIDELIGFELIRSRQGRAIGVAATQPISKENTVFSYAKNRRVEVVITHDVTRQEN